MHQLSLTDVRCRCELLADASERFRRPSSRLLSDNLRGGEKQDPRPSFSRASKCVLLFGPFFFRVTWQGGQPNAQEAAILQNTLRAGARDNRNSGGRDVCYPRLCAEPGPTHSPTNRFNTQPAVPRTAHTYEGGDRLGTISLHYCPVNLQGAGCQV